MQLLLWLAHWSKTRTPWAIVFFSALGLLLAALYFQYVLGHAPCVRCIYQRTAVIGIMIAALLPFIYPHFVMRTLGLILWGTSAIWGLLQARAHLEVIFPQSFFIPPCPFFPEFPAIMPLHEWLPLIFDAPGSCSSNDWQFLEMGMPEWMQIIFSLYIVGAIVALIAQIALLSRSGKAAK
jgi:disulfide bond formation protein DsbB